MKCQFDFLPFLVGQPLKFEVLSADVLTIVVDSVPSSIIVKGKFLITYTFNPT